jgi:hypothetical protein
MKYIAFTKVRYLVTLFIDNNNLNKEMGLEFLHDRDMQFFARQFYELSHYDSPRFN